MAGISINISNVIKASEKINLATRTAVRAKNSIDCVKANIDRNIATRKNISHRLKQVSEQLDTVRSETEKIKKITENAALIYKNTDNKLKKAKINR